MKKIFLLAIPITLAIVVAYYSYNFDRNQQGKITPQMLIQNGSPLIGSQNAPLTVVKGGIISAHIVICFMSQVRIFY